MQKPLYSRPAVTNPNIIFLKLKPFHLLIRGSAMFPAMLTAAFITRHIHLKTNLHVMTYGTMEKHTMASL